MVVTSMKTYEAATSESEVYTALRESEMEAELTDERLSPKEVLSSLRASIDAVIEE